YMRAPNSRMDVLTEEEIDSVVRHSELITQYNHMLDKDSAFEILSQKIEKSIPKTEEKTSRPVGRPRKERSTLETILNDSTTRSFIRTIGNQIIRGIFGKLIKR